MKQLVKKTRDVPRTAIKGRPKRIEVLLIEISGRGADLVPRPVVLVGGNLTCDVKKLIM